MSDCIDFAGYKTSEGYGRVCRKVNGKRKHFLAHRLAYSEVHGPISEGMCVCHKCDRPSCVNPDHLFLGTHTDNMRDMMAKGRGAELKGGSNPRSKLTDAEIPRIRDMLLMGCKQTDIAKWFGVSKYAIYLIKSGKTWAHVA